MQSAREQLTLLNGIGVSKQPIKSCQRSMGCSIKEMDAVLVVV